MEMATCFASPRASPVRGLLALFLLGGRKVWEAWEGRALGRPLLSPVFLLGGFLPCFCSVAGRCGNLGGAGFGYRVIPISRPLLSPVFLRGGRKKVWEAWEGRALGTELSLSRPLLSPVFLRDGRKVREAWERALGTELSLFQTSPFSHVFARWRKVWEGWEGRALGTELSVSRPPSPVCHCAKHGKRKSLERGNFME